jgi:hypothetical protein
MADRLHRRALIAADVVSEPTLSSVDEITALNGVASEYWSHPSVRCVVDDHRDNFGGHS